MRPSGFIGRAVLAMVVAIAGSGCEGLCGDVSELDKTMASVPPGTGQITWAAGTAGGTGALLESEPTAPTMECFARFLPALPLHQGSYPNTDDSETTAWCREHANDGIFSTFELSFRSGDQNRFEVGSWNLVSDVVLIFVPVSTLPFGSYCAMTAREIHIDLTVEEVVGLEQLPPEVVSSDYRRVFLLELEVPPNPSSSGSVSAEPLDCPELAGAVSVRFVVSAEDFSFVPGEKNMDCSLR